MGLLDGLLGTSIDDPRTMATAQAVQGLLSGGKALPAISNGLLAYGGSMQQSRQQKALEELRAAHLQQQQMQLQQAQRQAARQQQLDALPAQFMRSAAQTALAGGGGPTNQNAQAMGAAGPSFDYGGYSKALAGIDPMMALQMQAALKKDEPKFEKLGPGEVGGFVKGGKWEQAATAPAKEDDFIANMRAAGIQPGTPLWTQTINQWLRKQSTHQPPVNVTVSTEKGYGEKIAGGLAERDLAAIDAARSAPEMIASAQRIRSILASQKPITGTGADTRLALSKALHTAGITKGADVVATENLQRELSQATLAAIKVSGLGAGNGFSNADRDFLEKAAAGTLGVNAETLARTAELNERAARRSIDAGNAASKRVRSAPGLSTLPFPDLIQQPDSNVVDFGSLK